MDTQTFVNNFGAIAQAPGGIDRLRELVLDLAVKGQLVEQDPAEAPALHGLTDVRADKGEVVKGKVPGRSRVPRVPEDWEQACTPPQGWEWARVDDTGTYINGLAFKSADWHDSGLPIIRIQNLTDPTKEFNYARGDQPADRLVYTGDILVSWSATLNAFMWDRGDGVLNQHIFKAVPDDRILDKGFLYHLLRHTIREMAESEKAHGLVMKHINRGPFVAHPVLIPPLGEQHRIVAKVDELMTLCDELETQQQTRQQTTTRFRSSALDSLVNAESDDELQTAWNRVQENWRVVIDDSGTSDQIRALILGLGFRGRLTERVEGAEAASELLPRIAKARASTASGKRRSSQSDAAEPLVGSEQPYSIPGGWVWTRLGVLIHVSSGIALPASKMREGNVPVYGGNGVAGYHDEASVQESTVVIGRVGALCGNVHLTADSAWVTDNAFVTWFDSSSVDRDFLIWLLRASDLRQNDAATAQPVISGRKIYSIPVPLPPFAEQKRIAARIEELMDISGGLDQCLDSRDSIAAELSAAAASSLLESHELR